VMSIKKRYNYQIPHDFTSVYFDEIVKPDIRNGIIVFFKQLASLGFGRKDIKVFPEYTEAGKREYKTLFQAGQNSLGLPVRIRGRADLRIHTADDRFHIFDYKTGASDDEQLILYELYYYLIDTPLLLHRIFPISSKSCQKRVVIRQGFKSRPLAGSAPTDSEASCCRR